MADDGLKGNKEGDKKEIKDETEKINKKLKFCYNCGHKITGNVKYCPECGVKIE